MSTEMIKREVVDVFLLGEVLPVLWVIQGNVKQGSGVHWDVVLAPMLFLPAIAASILLVKVGSLAFRLRSDRVNGLHIRSFDGRAAVGALYHLTKAACVLLALPTVDGLSRFGNNAVTALPIAAAYAITRYMVDRRADLRTTD